MHSSSDAGPIPSLIHWSWGTWNLPLQQAPQESLLWGHTKQSGEARGGHLSPSSLLSPPSSPLLPPPFSPPSSLTSPHQGVTWMGGARAGRTLRELSAQSWGLPTSFVSSTSDPRKGWEPV